MKQKTPGESCSIGRMMYFYSLCATRQDRRQDVFENVATLEEMEVGPPEPSYRGRL